MAAHEMKCHKKNVYELENKLPWLKQNLTELVQISPLPLTRLVHLSKLPNNLLLFYVCK